MIFVRNLSSAVKASEILLSDGLGTLLGTECDYNYNQMIIPLTGIRSFKVILICKQFQDYYLL